ncbi:RNA polymerase sigma factor [Nonomuraea wenchangensis]
MNAPTRPGLDLDQVFDAYFPEIHRYIARRLSRDDADDLAGEVFLIAAEGGYEPSRGDVKPWLYGIATKLISRHHRSEVRRWRALSRTVEREAHSHEDTTLARVTAGALTGRLAGALARLNRGDRDVVLLVALGGFTHPRHRGRRHGGRHGGVEPDRRHRTRVPGLAPAGLRGAAPRLQGPEPPGGDGGAAVGDEGADPLPSHERERQTRDLLPGARLDLLHPGGNEPPSSASVLGPGRSRRTTPVDPFAIHREREPPGCPARWIGDAE